MEAARVEQTRVLQSPNRLGMILFIISETFLFGALFWAYYYLRANTSIWPPAGITLDTSYASVMTAILIASSGTIWLAGRAIRRGQESGLARGLIVTILLGSSFLGMTVWEWLHESFQPWTHAYGSIFFTLTGFHALHVFAGIMIMLVLLTRTIRHRFSSERFLAVEVGSLYWHFVDIVWLFVFTTIFIVK